MTVNIKARNFELTPSLRTYIKTKLNSLSRLFKHWDTDNDTVMVDFEIARTTNHHRKGDQVYYAEANVQVKGDLIRANRYGTDVRKAVDFVKDTLRRSLSKKKTKQFG